MIKKYINLIALLLLATAKLIAQPTNLGPFNEGNYYEVGFNASFTPNPITSVTAKWKYTTESTASYREFSSYPGYLSRIEETYTNGGRSVVRKDNFMAILENRDINIRYTATNGQLTRTQDAIVDLTGVRAMEPINHTVQVGQSKILNRTYTVPTQLAPQTLAIKWVRQGSANFSPISSFTNASNPIISVTNNGRTAAGTVTITPTQSGNYEFIFEYKNKFNKIVSSIFNVTATGSPTNSCSLTTNPRLDVNRDGVISPLDALLVINGLGLPYNGNLDVNNNGVLAPLDALLIINCLQ